MAFFDGFKKKSTLKSAINQVVRARKANGSKADELYKSAYQGFADVVQGDVITGEALYNWGFGLLHQAKSNDKSEAERLYLDAVAKFSFCSLIQPTHLGASIDGGVAYMELARLKSVDAQDELYENALLCFQRAEHIQSGSAAYNLACIYAVRDEYDACKSALELSLDSGSLPDIDEIEADPDMAKVINMDWFKAFVLKVTSDPEPEDENAVKYDAEGNVVKKNKKKKQPEFEVDGVVYDVEGNVIRQMDENEAQNDSVPRGEDGQKLDKNDANDSSDKKA